MQQKTSSTARPTFPLSGSDYPQTCGIYAIRNTLTGRYYVGKTGGSTRSTRDFRRRFREHACNLDLARGQHKSGPLQEDFKRYGRETFVFEILEVIDPSTSIEHAYAREQHWIDALDAAGSGYNRVPIACSGADGYKHTLEQIERRKATLALPEVRDRRAQSIRLAYADPELRAKTGERARVAHANPATKERQRAALKAAMASPDERARKGAAAAAHMASQRLKRIHALRQEVSSLLDAGGADLAALKSEEADLREDMHKRLAAGESWASRPVLRNGVRAAMLAQRARALQEARVMQAAGGGPLPASAIA